MDAPAPCAPGGSVVASRQGGIQTSQVARGGGGTRRHSSDSAGPGLCRRAPKPRRGCIAGPVGLPASAGLLDAAVRGCRDMSLKRRESAWRVAVRLRLGGRLGRRVPAGRGNAARVGREPEPVLVFRVCILGAPRNLMRGRESCREAASTLPPALTPLKRTSDLRGLGVPRQGL
jgi:hypothetical protein